MQNFRTIIIIIILILISDWIADGGIDQQQRGDWRRGGCRRARPRHRFRLRRQSCCSAALALQLAEQAEREVPARGEATQGDVARVVEPPHAAGRVALHERQRRHRIAQARLSCAARIQPVADGASW